MRFARLDVLITLCLAPAGTMTASPSLTLCPTPSMVAEGDKVWFLEKVTGTASSGKKMDATALTILRIVNGKFAEG